MKRKFVLYLGMALLTSCSFVRFENSQPVNSKELFEFPRQFIGEYANNKGDTLIILKDAFIIEEDNIKQLSNDSVVLKKTGKFYILSCRDLLNEGETSNLKGWEVFPFKFMDDSLIVYSVDPDKDNKEDIIKELEKVSVVKSELNEKSEVDYYLVNPTKKEFKTILKRNIFSEKLKVGRIK